MATTTYGTTDARSTNALYWGVAVVLFLAVIAFFALRPSPPIDTVAPPTPTSNVNGGAARMSTESGTSTTTTTNTPADDSSINTSKEVEAQKAIDSQAQ